MVARPDHRTLAVFDFLDHRPQDRNQFHHLHRDSFSNPLAKRATRFLAVSLYSWKYLGNSISITSVLSCKDHSLIEGIEKATIVEIRKKGK